MFTKKNGKSPVHPKFVVSDSVLMSNKNTQSFTMESFIYCPDLPEAQVNEFRKTYKSKTDDLYTTNSSFDISFERKHVKELVHLITSHLKKNATKIPLLILPFRKQHHDEDLKTFLTSIFVNGLPLPEKECQNIISSTNEYILMSALKFIWCRLPGKAIIGWKAYTKFVKLEEESDFPDKAFLDFMPNCLSSGAHASIVYDFFDLIVAFILHSKENLMTAHKISKLCGLWAFNPVRGKIKGLPSYERGLYEWIPAGDAMFHLLLAFVKSMPPNGDLSKLPKIFQSTIKSQEYPPLPTSSTVETSRHFQEIPMVTLRTNKPSKNPAELLTKVAKTLKFDDPTIFYTREDYLLLKRVFKNKDEVMQKLSPEGSRLLQNLCLYDEDLIVNGSEPTDLKLKLVPGWSTEMTSRDAKFEPNTNDLLTATVGRVTIDDYFIWTWLCSLGIEETDLKKKTFGKTYIMEVELAEGFKKWIIVEEQDLQRDGYDIEMEIKQQRLKELEQKIQLAEMEAERIKREAFLKAEKLEIQRHDARKAKVKQLSKVEDCVSPPPLPDKDYDEIPPRSKSRRPPPPLPKSEADQYQIPKKSEKRLDINQERITTNLSDEEICITLPQLEEEEPFLEYEALLYTDYDNKRRTKEQLDVEMYHEKNRSPRNKGYTSPPPPDTKDNYIQSAVTNHTPISSSSPNKLLAPMEKLPKATSPPRTYNPYSPMNSPPRVSPSPRVALPKAVSSGHVLPRAASPKAVSPGPVTPRTASPSRQPLPNQTPHNINNIHSNLHATNQSPQQARSSSPPPRSSPYMQQTSTVSSPNHSPSYYTPLSPSFPCSNEPQRPFSPENALYPSQPVTPTNVYYDSKTSPSPKPHLDLKKCSGDIPVLLPPADDASSTTFTPLSPSFTIPTKGADETEVSPSVEQRSPAAKSPRSPTNRAELEAEFSGLENEFQECMDDLTKQPSFVQAQVRKTSNSRLRKAPPSLKSSMVSENSSVYPSTTQSSERVLSVPEAEHEYKHSRKPSRGSKSSLHSTGVNRQGLSPTPSKQHMQFENTKSAVVLTPQTPGNVRDGVPHSNQQLVPPINGQYTPRNPPVKGQGPAEQSLRSPQPIVSNSYTNYSPQPALNGKSKPAVSSKSTYPTSQPPTRGYYPPANGYYPSPQQGYPPQQQSYPPPPRGYPLAQQGYPPSQQSYPPPPQGYLSPQQGYPPPQPGYPSPQQGYYQPQLQVPQGYYPPNPLVPPNNVSPYTNNVINNMPPSGKMDKLHGHQGLNKKNARNMFMSDAFGI